MVIATIVAVTAGGPGRDLEAVAVIGIIGAVSHPIRGTIRGLAMAVAMLIFVRLLVMTGRPGTA